MLRLVVQTVKTTCGFVVSQMSMFEQHNVWALGY